MRLNQIPVEDRSLILQLNQIRKDNLAKMQVLRDKKQLLKGEIREITAEINRMAAENNNLTHRKVAEKFGLTKDQVNELNRARRSGMKIDE